MTIILIDPKYAHNVGAVVRAASCYGLSRVIYSGTRVAIDIAEQGRIPREERMRGYKSVDIINQPRPFDLLAANAVPIAVEIKPGAIPLPIFEHPQNAVYVFGPEDGSLPQSICRLCHHFVQIPAYHCLNLSAAVYTVLYDRATKAYFSGQAEMLVVGGGK